MSRPAKVLLWGAMLAVAVLASACGTEKVNVPGGNDAVKTGAALFNQRCGGCHTLSYAGTRGSAENVRTAQLNNGPNFNVRCERPVARVLYAIENGGFSGVIMPQNVVVGQNAIDVAEFVAKYAGRQAPKVPGVVECSQTPIGSITEALKPTNTTPTNTGPSPQTLTGATTHKAPNSTTPVTSSGENAQKSSASKKSGATHK